MKQLCSFLPGGLLNKLTGRCKNAFTLSLITFSIGMILFAASDIQAQVQGRMLVRIYLASPDEVKGLHDMYLDFASLWIKEHADVVVTEKELEEIQRRGFKTEILKYEKDVIIDPEYHSYEETKVELDSLATLYPEIVKLYNIGVSTEYGDTIWALKISDNVEIDEDEPSILYDGIHHAREPLSLECCLYLINYLLDNYGTNPDVTRWIDNIEIWFIPIVNPEGYKYLVDNDLSFPWWRKNLRDNNENGQIDYDYDGVDLNRNYDFNWITGGSDQPASEVYRGPAPFSELETQAKRDLTLQQGFVLSVSYHSYGEIVVYPWAWNGTPSPDDAVLSDIAKNVASLITTQSGTVTYRYGPLDGMQGQSCNWMYGVAGVNELLIETGAEFIPPGDQIEEVAYNNAQGAMYLLDRVLGPGLTGHITDQNTGEPLSANVKILEIYSPEIEVRTSEPMYGRYYRLLQPGIYTVEVSKIGYETKVFNNVSVNSDTLTVLDVQIGSAPTIVYSEHWIDDDYWGDSQGDGDGIVDFSESIELPVRLQNIGKLPAYDVTAVLSADDQYINITDSVQSFGDIPVGSAMLSFGDFDFDVSANVPNQHIITFKLSISDSIGRSWKDEFEIQATAPELIYIFSKVVDSLGNNNGLADPGETIDLFITIMNEGGQGATNVSGTLTSHDPLVSVNIDEATFGDVPAYREATSKLPYNVSIDASYPEPYSIEFTLSITADKDYFREGSFSISVGEGFAVDVEIMPPGWTHFAFTGGYKDEWHRSTWRNHTPSGNYSWKCGAVGTGNYSNMVDAALVTPLINIGDNYRLSFWHWINAETDVGSTAWDGGIVMIDDGSGWTQIEPIGGYPYTITDVSYPDPFEGGTPCFSGMHDWTRVKFDLSSYAGSAVRFMFRFGTDVGVTREGWYIDDIAVYGMGPPDVLVVDDDGGDSYETYFTQSLERIDVSFDSLKSADGITSPLLSNYKAVIWFTGDNPNPVDSSCVLALSDYLDSGGNLLITGQDVEGCADTNFYQNYLHAELLDDDAYRIRIDGVEGDPIGDGLSSLIVGAPGAHNQDSPSIISPTEGADSIFNYRMRGCCGVKYENDYKVVYLSFGFEAISDVPTADTVMARILRWFELFTGIEEEVVWQDSPGITQFLKTGPNPFRGELQIEYCVQSPSMLELRVYDIAGRMVRELLREPKTPGVYRVKWDGKNSLGARVPQGVYFLHLSDGREDCVKKCVLLR